ncbi:flagellar hook-length control protein FliK [Shewanella marina]|uniref:flagellar hook-length control protein FliK n=1 Tax=Shewanella marina TaxID=487319 RepID=UPI000472B885|nr:flagellar hook-length control protein FliK [Shewanella marina]
MPLSLINMLDHNMPTKNQLTSQLRLLNYVNKVILLDILQTNVNTDPKQITSLMQQLAQAKNIAHIDNQLGLQNQLTKQTLYATDRAKPQLIDRQSLQLLQTITQQQLIKHTKNQSINLLVNISDNQLKIAGTVIPITAKDGQYILTLPLTANSIKATLAKVINNISIPTSLSPLLNQSIAKLNQPQANISQINNQSSTNNIGTSPVSSKANNLSQQINLLWQQVKLNTSPATANLTSKMVIDTPLPQAIVSLQPISEATQAKHANQMAHLTSLNTPIAPINSTVSSSANILQLILPTLISLTKTDNLSQQLKPSATTAMPQINNPSNSFQPFNLLFQLLLFKLPQAQNLPLSATTQQYIADLQRQYQQLNRSINSTTNQSLTTLVKIDELQQNQLQQQERGLQWQFSLPFQFESQLRLLIGEFQVFKQDPQQNLWQLKLDLDLNAGPLKLIANMKTNGLSLNFIAQSVSMTNKVSQHLPLLNQQLSAWGFSLLSCQCITDPKRFTCEHQAHTQFNYEV